jgi:DNA-binding FadR family transcriptional regulator
MALYLDYRGVGSDDLLEVRHAIELGALGEVMARHDDPEVAELLGNAIERSAEPSAPERPTGADLFHSELVRLAGNPVLTLFLRILSELWTRHTTNTPGPQPGPDAVATVEKVHGRILDAVLAGDTELARHRMRRHLDALKAWYH